MGVPVGTMYSSMLKLLDYSLLLIHAGDYENVHPNPVSLLCIRVARPLVSIA